VHRRDQNTSRIVESEKNPDKEGGPEENLAKGGDQAKRRGGNPMAELDMGSSGVKAEPWEREKPVISERRACGIRKYG